MNEKAKGYLFNIVISAGIIGFLLGYLVGRGI